ncbi:hypothetical protein SKAU_G00033630 [Synaphobranchus kaupii]|uniref:ZP domain-containing protein n=1 Tax=Synaphobranchus kaupii TaxID=118154 RepID=A0A9Q1GFI8_SYNKA|nr:hypothetical protein SKAU_G00033630 [Synaphobranchus kaupii]
MPQLKFLLVLLLTWFTSKVAPRKLSKNLFKYNRTESKFRHLADHSMHDSVSPFNGDLAKSQSDATLKWERQSTDGLSAQLEESVKSTGLKLNRELKETDSLDLSLACKDVQMKLALSDEPLSRGSRGVLSRAVLESCGHPVSNGLNSTVLVKDCDITLSHNGHCSTRVKYETANGQLADVTLPCTAHHRSYPNDHHLDDQFNPDSLQADSPITPLELKCFIPVDPIITCNGDQNKRICGHAGTYPMDECTPDKHFVFVIHRNISDIALDLTKLRTSGASDCLPKIITDTFVVFTFSIAECGVRSYDLGDSTVFSVEVVTSVSPTTVISGSISRELQYRMMVECRYLKIQPEPDLSVQVSAGFMVMSPTIYPMVQSEGLFSVQLRIAEDDSYTNFHPSYHQALRLLLGKPVYLEVSLKSFTNPIAVLLVHYCIAYPKMATKALVLLHDGCPNPLDVGGVVIVSPPGSKHARRFEVKVFQFMDAPNEYLDVQIYFMCSTELCFPTPGGKTCEEGCFLAGR